MGDVIAADFKAKKNLGKVEPPLEVGLKIIAEAMAPDLGNPDFMRQLVAEQNARLAALAASGIDGLAWPGMDVQSPYMSDEKDPA